MTVKQRKKLEGNGMWESRDASRACQRLGQPYAPLQEQFSLTMIMNGTELL